MPAASLDELRWTDPRLPGHTAVVICPAEARPQIDAKGLLLSLLADEFAVPIDDIELHPPRRDRRFRFGRAPALAEFRGTRVCTSVARTAGCVAAAVSRHRIGIDVEQTQTHQQAEDLLELFHPQDRADVSRLAETDRAFAVTTIWTRIEAALKMRGTSLRIDPGTVRAGLGPRSPALSRVRMLSVGCDRHGRLGEPDSASSEYSISVAWDRWEHFSFRP